MTVDEILNQDEKSNTTIAKRIAQRARAKAKKANAGDSDVVTGWRSDAHHGSHVSTFLNR